MKKLLLVGVIAVTALLASSAMTKADEVPTCPEGQMLVDGVCKPIPSSTPLYLILAQYCKADVVEYTEWSECDKRFGKNGLQWRSIVRPTPGGCLPSVADQLATQRECID